MNKLKTFVLSVLLCYVTTGWKQQSYAAENVSVWEFSYYGYNITAGVSSYYVTSEDCLKAANQMYDKFNNVKVSDCYQVNKFM